MADTANFGWSKPIVGGSVSTWGTELNELFDAADADLKAVKNTADAAMPKAGGSFTGEIEVKTERYTVEDGGNLSGSVTFNLANADVQRGTVTGDITGITFSNVPPSDAVFLTLELTDGGAHTITWPASIKWDGDAEPTLQSAGVDLIILYTRDGGTTWRGMHAGTFGS